MDLTGMVLFTFFGGVGLAWAIILIAGFVDEEIGKKLDDKLWRLFIPCAVIAGIAYIAKHT
jgi:hypothetical protein